MKQFVSFALQIFFSIYKMKSESDNTVVEEVNTVVEKVNTLVEEVNKKLVKEYHDFFVEILQRWKVIMDMVVVDKLVEEVNKKLVEEYNDFLKFSSVRFKI